MATKELDEIPVENWIQVSRAYPDRDNPHSFAYDGEQWWFYWGKWYTLEETTHIPTWAFADMRKIERRIFLEPLPKDYVQNWMINCWNQRY